MARVIWKFRLPPPGRHVLPMPRGAKLLCVQLQGNQPCLWAEVDLQAPLAFRGIAVRGTGVEFSEADAGTYVGTWQTPGKAYRMTTSYVWHVYDLGEVLDYRPNLRTPKPADRESALVMRRPAR